MDTKKLTLNILGKDFTFNLTPEDYNAAMDEVVPGNKTQPAHNFCMRCIDEKDKAELAKILEQPTAAWQIWSFITQEYVPNLNIQVGKLSG
jgi:hypothetical protein